MDAYRLHSMTMLCTCIVRLAGRGIVTCISFRLLVVGWSECPVDVYRMSTHHSKGRAYQETTSTEQVRVHEKRTRESTVPCTVCRRVPYSTRFHPGHHPSRTTTDWHLQSIRCVHVRRSIYRHSAIKKRLAKKDNAVSCIPPS